MLTVASTCQQYRCKGWFKMTFNRWITTGFIIAIAINVFAASEESKKKESVWDYPRPPKVEKTTKKIQVIFQEVVLAETVRSKRVLQNGQAPVYYIPQEDIQMKYLIPTSKNSTCEFKGTAVYYDIRIGSKTASNAGWSYPEPTQGYEEIKDYIAFYPRLMDACYVDGERVKPEPGEYLGGWITSDIVGPFEGESE
jgi:uncharacterized protein (DUF427 family)